MQVHYKNEIINNSGDFGLPYFKSVILFYIWRRGLVVIQFDEISFANHKPGIHM